MTLRNARCNDKDNEWVLRIGGMVLTEENCSTRRETCASVTFATINPTWIDLGMSPGLYHDRLAFDVLNHEVACRH